MKLGVSSVLLADKSLEDALKYINVLGVNTLEIGWGGFPVRLIATSRIFY
jgi:sugar phosphate isomerase/epimerase